MINGDHHTSRSEVERIQKLQDEVFNRGCIPWWIAAVGYMAFAVLAIIVIPFLYTPVKWCAQPRAILQIHGHAFMVPACTGESGTQCLLCAWRAVGICPASYSCKLREYPLTQLLHLTALADAHFSKFFLRAFLSRVSIRRLQVLHTGVGWHHAILRCGKRLRGRPHRL